MKNMKIEINEQQPLEDVVRELERLGFSRAYIGFDNISCVCTYDVYFNCYSTDKNQFGGELTTLAELRSMSVE